MLGGLLLAAVSSGLGQAPSAPRNLAVAGHSGTAPIMRMGGRLYVSIDDLARLAQASLTYRGDQIVLSLSAPPTDAAPPAAAAPVKAGFSKDFLAYAIEQMSVVREWQVAIVSAIQEDRPISKDWVEEQRRRSDKHLALVSASISTEDDRSAYALLSGESANMQRFSEGFLAARGDARYIDPDSVEDDPLNQKIDACAKSLSSMATENRYRDEPACH